MNREEDIIKWALERHIFARATPGSQHGKTLEEVQELTDALAANNEAEIKDAIGDIVVTLILQAHMHGWSLEECVEAAYQEIRDRKGRMVDGVFVKEGGVNRDERSEPEAAGVDINGYYQLKRRKPHMTKDKILDHLTMEGV